MSPLLLNLKRIIDNALETVEIVSLIFNLNAALIKYSSGSQKNVRFSMTV